MVAMGVVEAGQEGQEDQEDQEDQDFVRTGLVHSEKSPSHYPDHGTVRF